MQPVAVEGRPVVEMADQPEVSVRLLSSQFMKTMGIAIVRGREFTDADTRTSAPVVLVSESMARQFWPNDDPIGKRLTLTFFPNVVRQVIGVVGDVKDRGLDNQDPISTLYWPMTQFYTPEAWGQFRAIGLALAVRTASDPAGVTAAVRHAIHEVSPATPLIDVRPMGDIVSESLSPQRFNMLLLAAFAGLALVLATVGLYSVVAYATRQRVKEIGIRIALGADRFSVLRGVVLDGLRPTLIGIAIGIAAAILLSHVLTTLIFGVQATDVPTYAAVAGLLAAVGVFADRTFFNLNFQPVMPIKVTPEVNLIARTIVPVVSIQGPEALRFSGVADIPQQLFFTPSSPGKVIWGTAMDRSARHRHLEDDGVQRAANDAWRPVLLQRQTAG